MSPKLLLTQLPLVVVLVALSAAPARAERQFTRVIASDLQLGYEPPCSVCHLTNKTGSPTVTTLFAYALRDRGLASDRQSLTLALTRLADDQADSDGDGVAERTDRIGWYEGPTVVEALDLLEPARPLELLPLRLPVQAIYKFDDRRIVAGRIESGSLASGDEIVIMPAGTIAKIRSVESWPVTPV